MTGVVYAIISGPQHGWTSAHVGFSALVGLVVLAAFVVWELRIPYPMLDMHFFRNQQFTGAVAGAILVAFGMGGSLFLLTQHLQFVLGYGALEAGLRTAPMALTVVVLNLTGVGARILPKLGTPRRSPPACRVSRPASPRSPCSAGTRTGACCSASS